ncbi:Short-chain dehydrogenase/reductase SDR [Penicillium lagena]|uniref:Short-chain dehydrogenase/reductase SDR n=1 Tax=Penicillium lagena TaxID=94218 RepID=UPI00254102E8|nr:Short-chain dehydrogenase/reductase SDR [Penicillium lagena]KAJ5606427.1 Short-chain dehydrogenase/reductase SDR [Penicillium lagena]
MAQHHGKVLITGCSDGSLGSALAIAFHESGLQVYATARDPSKMTNMTSRGIRTLQLDVLSDSSIAACVREVPELDILVNNAGGGYSMPMSDISIPDAKKIFDLNVWSYIAVTQAFLPLLMKSKGMIVNHTSAASVCGLPFQSAYNASKAAMAAFSETQRLELEPFGIKVVDLKTGFVLSKIQENQRKNMPFNLPRGSIYGEVKDVVENSTSGFQVENLGIPAENWANQVVNDLLRTRPPYIVWRGAQAWLARIGSVLPTGTLDNQIKKLTGLDLIERRMN